MWIRVREPDGVDKPDQRDGRHGLLGLEQRPEPVVLRLQLLQGRLAGQPPAGVEEGQYRPHRRRRRSHLGLHHRLQRLQERPDRGTLPPLQAGLRLVRFSEFLVALFVNEILPCSYLCGI